MTAPTIADTDLDVMDQVMARLGRLRPASAADWRHALGMSQVPGVTVEVTIKMTRDQPWEVTYRRQ